MNPTNPAILLTIDVEDWFQVENLRPSFPPSTWNRQQLRVEQNTHSILDLLDSINLSSATNSEKPMTPCATFFILGWISKRLPNLIREIKSRGHEVASHGHNHLMCSQLNEKDLKHDLIRSKKTIEDIIGVEVRGYRAPNFSISDKTLELVESAGYRYDSSYNNFSKHGRYGTISLDRHKKAGVAIKISHDFIELPISNLTLGNQTVPWGGGGYFRLLPLPIFKAGMRRILKRTNAYIFYMHPWEIDPRQPRVKEINRLSSWRHYLNLDKTLKRLHSLITAFRHNKFQTCHQYLNDVMNPKYETDRSPIENQASG